MRCALEIDSPPAAAVPRGIQCVASGGALSSVRTIAASIRSSSIAGRPGTGLVRRPSRLRSRKRLRHLGIACVSWPDSAATRLCRAPFALASTACARRASACAVVRRAAKPRSSPRSVSAAPTVACRRCAHARGSLARHAESAQRRTSDPEHERLGAAAAVPGRLSELASRPSRRPAPLASRPARYRSRGRPPRRRPAPVESGRQLGAKLPRAPPRGHAITQPAPQVSPL